VTGYDWIAALHKISQQGRHIRLAQPEKLVVAEHSFTQCHVIQLHDTKILSTKSGHMGCLIVAAIKLESQLT
jgi:hypothetical protein